MMTLDRTPRTRVQRIIKMYVVPYLHEKGFHKPGRSYCRRLGQLLHIAKISPSSINNRDKYGFGVTVGIHIPFVIAHFWKRPEPPSDMKILPEHGLVHCAPSLILVPRHAQEWEIRSEDAPEKDIEVGHDIRSVIEEGAFSRFFDRFQHPSDVANFLSRARSNADQQISPAKLNMCNVYAGIIWDQLGESQKCKECLRRAVELTKGKRLEADIEHFARKYVCGKLPRIASS